VPAARAAVEPIHALLIAGGCCHDYEAQKTILTEGISARANVTWDILFEGGSSKGRDTGPSHEHLRKARLGQRLRRDRA
jgi:hypothetical protein